MVHSYGYKSGTRHLFQKKFRKHGVPGVLTILQNYKVGDYVDVVADPSVRAGMPHKFYHGRTGIVWNVTPRGVGVMVNKVIGTRTLRKRICVRFEHVRKSACRAGFLAKAAAVRAIRQAKKEGKPMPPKAKSYRGASIVRKAKVEKLARVQADYDAYVTF